MLRLPPHHLPRPRLTALCVGHQVVVIEVLPATGRRPWSLNRWTAGGPWASRATWTSLAHLLCFRAWVAAELGLDEDQPRPLARLPPAQCGILPARRNRSTKATTVLATMSPRPTQAEGSVLVLRLAAGRGWRDMALEVGR